MLDTRPRVVVGVSDTPSGRAALVRGIHAAQERHATLDLVRVWRDVGRLYSMSLQEAMLLAASQEQDQRILDDALEVVRVVAPELVVTTDLERGDLYRCLTDRAKDADLLVLGAGDSPSSEAIPAWFAERLPIPVQVVPAGAAAGTS